MVDDTYVIEVMGKYKYPSILRVKFDNYFDGTGLQFVIYSEFDKPAFIRISRYNVKDLVKFLIENSLKEGSIQIEDLDLKEYIIPILNEAVSNKIKLILTCLYVSCKENNNTKFLLRHVVEFVQKVGYNITNSDIIQNSLKYRKYFKHIKKVSEDYISGIVSRIIDYDGIVGRMKITHPSMNIIEAKRIFEETSFDILKRYPKQLRGCNPISFAMATVYTTTLLIKYKYGFVDLLTPENMDNATGLSASATREVFLKYFRPILIKDKIVSENKFKEYRKR